MTQITANSTFADIKDALKSNGYTGKLSGQGITKQFLFDQFQSLSSEVPAMTTIETTAVDTTVADDSTEVTPTTLDASDVVSIQSDAADSTALASIETDESAPLVNYQEMSVSERLHTLHQRRLLFKPAKTKNDDIVAISPTQLVRFFTQPLEQLIKPFNQTFYRDDTDKASKDATKETYRGKLINLLGRNLTIKFIETNDDKPVEQLRIFYASLSYDTDRDTWVVMAYSDKDLSNEIELPFSRKQFQKLDEKVLKFAVNLPLIRLFEKGKISQENLVSIILMYVYNATSKHFVKMVDNTEVRISADASTIKFIGQLLFDQMSRDSSASIYSMKDYLEKFINVNWSLITDHVSMEFDELPSDSEQPALMGSDMFGTDANDSF